MARAALPSHNILPRLSSSINPSFRPSASPSPFRVACILDPVSDSTLQRDGLKVHLKESLRVHTSDTNLVDNGSPNIVFPDPSFDSVDQKANLTISSRGMNRGIFGVPVIQKTKIEQLIQLLESQSPVSCPTEQLDKVKGEWKLLYSTISILGSKRTKLGLRDFITLGDFLQVIDVEKSTAKNIITFTVAGLGMLSGALMVEASYVVSSVSRVDIRFEKSSIVPEQLLKLFQKNYDLLLNVFNPEGWLEITYLDDDMRVGRDDKGNIFLLERPISETD